VRDRRAFGFLREVTSEGDVFHFDDFGPSHLELKLGSL
jgi:hypothetical protein